MTAGLTVLNLYHLTGTAAEFGRAIDALARRVEAEGNRGILTYRFFVNAPAGTARAVIDYADAAAWIGHHDTAMEWPEMRALHGVARLVDVTFLGEVTPDIRDWIDRSTLTARLETGFTFTAGFRR